MRQDKAETRSRVRINTVLTGEPAMLLENWKRRGIINSYTDGVIQALRAFDLKVTEQDLKRFQLRSLKDIDARARLTKASL